MKTDHDRMGLTPLEGLPGARRSGTIDPRFDEVKDSWLIWWADMAYSLVLHLSHKPHVADGLTLGSFEKTIQLAETLLNSESGWKALTGTSDFEEISTSEEHSCRLAFDILVDRIIGYIGSYFVKLNGQCDALVFAGGIGENCIPLRRAVICACESLGFLLDDYKNENSSNVSNAVMDIGIPSSKPKVLICHTDEQVGHALLSSHKWWFQSLFQSSGLLTQGLAARNGIRVCETRR